MATAPTVQEFLQRNSEYQHDHAAIETFGERLGKGSEGPKVAIVTCADPRCIPEKFLQLNTWDAVVVRTAGSNVKAAMPSLLAIDSIVGLREIMVVNHTDCGALAWRDSILKKDFQQRVPAMSHEIDAMDLGEIASSLEDRVREHTAFAKEYPLLRAELRRNITGYLFDLETGNLKRIH